MQNNDNYDNNYNDNGNGNHDENTEKVLILPLNADSKKITQTLSNDTALKILELLAQKPMSSTAIADEMGLALTTIKYNLDALIECDLIKVNKTRWSKKGREIKIYEPVQKLIVVMPGGGKSDKASLIGMLQKYLSMIGAAIFASFGIEYLAKLTGSSMNMQAVTDMAESGRMVEAVSVAVEAEELAVMQLNDSLYGSAPVAEALMNDTARIIQETVMDAAPMLADAPAEMDIAAKSMEPVATGAAEVINQGLASHIGLWFFLGCMFVILILLMRELYYRKKSI
ncbi:MAG: winged helix-turn-helix domain-containing protein [Methanosarcinaceae archaeon]|nr:winged helix-turn-helix domain-containing protein [Methanosarcinaceae archaeon]